MMRPNEHTPFLPPSRLLSKKLLALLLFLLLAPLASHAADNQRQLVKLPPMMQQHMLANMRDHLVTLNAIHEALAASDFDKAAELAEARLGMSSLSRHGASHMAPYMPETMRSIGTDMHHKASQFAIVTRESAVENDLRRPLSALSQVTEQCIACHSRYRIH